MRDPRVIATDGQLETAGLRALVAADYAANYGEEEGSRGRRALLAVARVVSNPSMHATILVRLLIGSPRWLSWVWRNLLITKHGIDVHRDASIGPGLALPHPFGIVIGTHVGVGSRVTLFHHVTLGVRRLPKPGELQSGRRMTPVVGDGVVVYPNSVVAGSITVGARAVIGACSYVDHDVPAGAVLHGATRASAPVSSEAEVRG